jgi:NADPH:quinone reductase-like Zn-dependent oxidoreductase
MHPASSSFGHRVREEVSLTVNAVTLDSLEAQPALRDDLPAPAVADDEVLVRVHSSSVNPVDNAIAAGMLGGMVEHTFPVILGRDYAGVVEQVGANVTRYAPGDQVYGFVLHADPDVHDGSWAELIAVPEDTQVAQSPAGIDIATAGAAPLAGIAALGAIDALELSAGDTLLVVGATGGVGSLAVQLAARAGGTVIAPALPEDEPYLRDLGVTELLPRDGDLVAHVRERHADGVDALLDLVSYTPGSYDATLKTDARVASTAGAAGEGAGRTNVMAVPSVENLQRLGTLLTDRSLRVPVQATYTLAQAPGALAARAATHSQGKLAIQIA